MLRSLIYYFVLLPTTLLAQVSIDDFLFSALEAPSIKAFDSQHTFLDSNPYKLSFIRRMEFRTESNQLDLDRQDYALRINPANPWEMKRNNQYFQTYQEASQLNRHRELKKILKEYYVSIINWAYLEEQKNIKREEQKNAQTQIKILEAQRFSNFFDANDYVELKIDQLEQIVALEELYFEEEAQRSKIEFLYPSAKNQTISWSLNKLISIEKIENLMEDHITKSFYGEVAYRQKQVHLAESEWALEKSNINIGYLQAQYQQYRIEQDRKPWSIGLGVAIPVFNPNKGDMTKRKLEMIEAEGNLANAKSEQQTGIELMKKKVKTLTKRYYNLQKQLDSLNIEALAPNLQHMNNNNPMTVVRLENSLIKSKNISALLRREIYLTYINYLGYAEMLQQLPIRNYLSPNLK